MGKKDEGIMVGTSIKGLFLISIAAFIFGVVKKVQEQQLSFSFDNHSTLSNLSCEGKNAVQSFLLQSQALYKNPKQCAQAVSDQFPFIKKVTVCATYPYGAYKVAVHAAHARALINQEFVLSDHDTISNRSAWNQEHLEKVPEYTIASLNVQNLDQACKTFLKTLDPRIHEQYRVEWVDISLVKFHDKAQPRITVLASSEQACKTLLHPDYQQLKKLVIEEKCATTKGQKKWCIDTRFKNQMIVFEGGRS